MILQKMFEFIENDLPFKVLSKLVVLLVLVHLVIHLFKMFENKNKNQTKEEDNQENHNQCDLIEIQAKKFQEIQEIVNNKVSDEIIEKKAQEEEQKETKEEKKIKVFTNTIEKPPTPKEERPCKGKPTLFVCTKCELAINRYLDPVDIEDLLRSEPSPIEDLQEHIKPGVIKELKLEVQEAKLDAEENKEKEEGKEGGEENLTEKEKKKKEKKEKKEKKIKTTGEILYEKVVSEFEKSDLKDEINIQPIKCLSTCYHSNSIAFSCEGRYTYQFGDLDHNSSAKEILEFSRIYLDVPEGFTKTKQRPPKLKQTLLARVPPLNYESAFT